MMTRKNSRRKNYIPILHIHLTDHCNLNCRGCDNFSPLAPKVFANVEVVERDLQQISELSASCVREIQLLGGEPLLHSNVIEFLNMARNYFPHTSIKLVSNGVLLPQQTEGFWESCRRNNIEIVVTRYPVKINHAAIEQLAKSKNVRFSFYGNTREIEKSMQCMPLDTSGKQNGMDSFLRCASANRCIALDNGRIYTCTTIPYVKYFNASFNKNLNITDRDSLDIHTVSSIDEILDFICQPMPFCRYCNQKGIIWDIGFGVSQKNIEEWTGRN